MKCPGCGHDNTEGTKFCTSCGSSLAEATASMDAVQPETQATPAPPAAVAPTQAFEAPAVSPRKKMKRSTKVIIVVVAAVLVVGGATAGIIAWQVAESHKPVAEILSMSLTRTDNKALDLKKVPLDKELALKVRYRAKFDETGSGTLKLVITTPEEGKAYELSSSDDPKEKVLKYSMTLGTGKPREVKAEIIVKQGDEKLKASRTLAYTSVKGKGAAILLEEAKDAALKKCDEATNTLKATAAANINVTDLADRLSKALETLKAAKKASEADAVTATAQGVIDECNARKAAADAAARDAAARDQDIAAAKQVMYNHANAEKGNAESISLVDFSMNNERTHATATYMGMVTVHTDPDNAGQKNYFYLTADKQNGQWVVTSFRYEFVQ